MRGSNAAEIATLVNAIVDAYCQEIVQSEREADLERLDILRRSYRKMRENYQDQLKSIQTLAEGSGTADDHEWLDGMDGRRLYAQVRWLPREGGTALSPEATAHE